MPFSSNQGYPPISMIFQNKKTLPGYLLSLKAPYGVHELPWTARGQALSNNPWLLHCSLLLSPFPCPSSSRAQGPAVVAGEDWGQRRHWVLNHSTYSAAGPQFLVQSFTSNYKSFSCCSWHPLQALDVAFPITVSKCLGSVPEFFLGSLSLFAPPLLLPFCFVALPRFACFSKSQ